MIANILVVEDEPAIQELLAFNLTECGYRAISAIDSPSAMSHIKNDPPDLILLDWMLPGRSGIELAHSLRTDLHTRNIPIIILSARNDERDKVLGLESGADDYVTKPFSPRELMARIRAVLRRSSSHVEKSKDNNVSMSGLELSITSHRVRYNGTEVKLFPTEFRVLHFFMTHAEHVYSRAQIMELVWGFTSIQERTVDVHISRLRQALKPFGLNNLLQRVHGVGYRFSSNNLVPQATPLNLRDV